MDFFEHQDVARRKTGRLVVLMVLAVLAITGLIFAVVVVAFLVINNQQTDALAGRGWERLPWGSLLGGTFVAVAAVVGSGSLYKTSQLAGGGKVVATSLGGRPVEPGTTDPDERRLLNVVEEMAIASGSPVPGVYLLDQEEGINAFAAGWNLDDAVIGVTRGCVQQLSRDELQGVIAHEFSHILHGDMRINLRLIGLIFGILVISVIGGGVMRSLSHSGRRSRSRSESGGGVLVAIFLAGISLYIIGYVGVFFGRLIQAAVSRQREFLADASAVQYTRNPDGIGDALRRIGGLAEGSQLGTAHASEHRHLFFGNSARRSFTRLFATHPPLKQRVKRVLPQWDGTYLGPRPENEREQSRDDETKYSGHGDKYHWRKVLDRVTHPVGGGLGLPGTAGLVEADVPGEAGDQAEAEVPSNREPTPSIDLIGETTPAHMEYAVALIGALPEQVYAATQTADGAAQAVVLAMLVERGAGPTCASQLEYLRQQTVGPVAAALERLVEPVAGLPLEMRLPLLDLALPALRSLHPRMQERVQQHLEALIEIDGRLVMFEWALRQVLRRHLSPHAPRPRGRKDRLRDHPEDVGALLAALARAGTSGGPHDTENLNQKTAAQDAALAEGLRCLPLELPPAAVDAADLTVRDLSEAVDRLAWLRPLEQRALIRACAATVSADGRVTAAESELLRAVAESLGVPVPPLLAGQSLI